MALEVASFSEADRVGIFDESLSVHEDVALADKIKQSGKRIVFAPEVRIGNKRDTSFLLFTVRNFKMALASRKIGVHRLAHLVLAVLAICVSALFIAYPFLPPAILSVILIFIGIYCLILLAGAVEGYRRTNWIKVVAIIPVLMIFLHLSRGFGYIWPVFRKNRRQ